MAREIDLLKSICFKKNNKSKEVKKMSSKIKATNRMETDERRAIYP